MSCYTVFLEKRNKKEGIKKERQKEIKKRKGKGSLVTECVEEMESESVLYIDVNSGFQEKTGPLIPVAVRAQRTQTSTLYIGT
jgi:hypothetical protein